jgi:hypothetical protein
MDGWVSGAWPCTPTTSPANGVPPNRCPLLLRQILAALSGLDTSGGLHISGHSLVGGALLSGPPPPPSPQGSQPTRVPALTVPVIQLSPVMDCGFVPTSHTQGAAMAALAAFNLSDTYKINTMYTYVLGEGGSALLSLLATGTGTQHWFVAHTVVAEW